MRHWWAPFVMLLAWAFLGLHAHAQQGILKVTSNAANAEVWLNGETIGSAPVTRYVAVGVHQLRVVADNHDPFVRRIEVVADTTIEVVAEMNAGGSTIEFVSDPPATLIINGAEWPTPVRLKDQPAGPYQYRIEAEGHQAVEDTFDFRSGQNILIDVTLKSSAGLVTINSDPAGARVRSATELVGTTPLTLDSLDPGPYTFLLDVPGHAMVAETVDTSDGGAGEISAYLPRGGVPVTVNTGHPSAEVRVEGVNIGNGERVGFRAKQRGSYNVSVLAPNLAPAEMTLDVSGKQVELRAAMRGGSSNLRRVRPLLQRWTFWAGSAAVLAGVGVGTWALSNELQTEPTPNGDVVVTFP